ncbi:MAG: hemolysin family protein [Pseudomonadota bacterium]
MNDIQSTDEGAARPDGEEPPSPRDSTPHDQGPLEPLTDTALVPYEGNGRRAPGFLQRLVYLFRPQTNLSARENLQDALANDHPGDQTISDGERAMLANILRLREVKVADVMIPRADIQAIDHVTSLEEVLKLFEESGHSRMPMYCENLDDPRGMIHIRDVMGYLTKAGAKKRRRRKTDPAAEKPVEPPAGNGQKIDLSRIDLTKKIAELKLMRPILYVPPSMLASDLMARMQAQRIQIALVIDEYGGTDGLVSLEDIVEMVVGDIEDEHDDEEEVIQQIGTGGDRYLIDAKADLDGLREQLGNNFVDAAISREDEVDTIGGLIFSILGRVPVRGEVVPPFGGFDIEVTDADPRRIKRVRLSRVKHGVRRAHVSKREPVTSEKAD